MIAGGVSGAAGVILGALNAHAFKASLPAMGLATLERVASYALLHGLLLVVIASWSRTLPEAISLRISGIALVSGIILFCGGLTVKTLGGPSLFGGLAPAGGMALIGGWIMLAWFGLTRL